MSPTNALGFKREVISKKRDADVQLLDYTDRESRTVYGWIPGPFTFPESVKPWWGEQKTDTMIRLSEFKTVSPNARSDRGAVMIFMSVESGKLWIWTYEIPKNAT